MTLPVRTETREKHNLIEETRDSLRRAKDLLKTLKSSGLRPITMTFVEPSGDLLSR
jgi:hypothetical protein